MKSARRGEGVLSHSDFLCIFGQSLLPFLLTRREGVSNFFIFRMTSYVSDPASGK